MADAKRLASVIRYVEALWNKYPNPITRVELAKSTGVSKAAITKVKDKIFDVCQVEALARNSKFVLRKDLNTINTVFLTSLLSGRLSSFLQSPYLLAVLSDRKVLKKFEEAIPSYREYFTEQDSILFINLLLKIASKATLYIKEEAINDIEWSFENEQYAFTFFSSAVLKFLRELDNDRLAELFEEIDVRTLLILRDKLYFLVTNLVQQIIPSLGIVSRIENEKLKKTYIAVYQDTFNYYLRIFFENLTGIFIRTLEKSDKGNVSIEDMRIGNFFQPRRDSNKPNSINIQGGTQMDEAKKLTKYSSKGDAL